jgi:acyl-CoA synthetase (AMP-forming)/AMP-acid ligase II
MSVLNELSEIWKGSDQPFLLYKGDEVNFDDVLNQPRLDLSTLSSGDVVAIVGDFDPETILTLLRLIDLRMIVVPLTPDTSSDHGYFFESAYVDAVIQNGKLVNRIHFGRHELIDELKQKDHGGLVLFSTGTTGRPKAILHDMSHFLKRFETPRPAFRTLSFLLFDHIGGINTLFHTLFNKGVVISPSSRTVESILETCQISRVEVLPTTPTFLRMLLMAGAIPERIPKSLKVITYGTERMDEPTLSILCELLPEVDFRQTFGMSELGILRVKSEARDSLFMKIGGEGIEFRIVDNVLEIRAQFRMLGYLNAPSPFDLEGWYNTKDIVELKDGLIKVTGRSSDVINVGGLKFMASEVERVALNFDGVVFTKVFPGINPITGEHAEMIIQPKSEQGFDLKEFKNFLKLNLRSHMVPRRIRIESIEVGHRFKRK